MTVLHFDRDAERDTLGAILSAASYSVECGWKIHARAKATGLKARHFWLPSHGALWLAFCRSHHLELPLDAVRRGQVAA